MSLFILNFFKILKSCYFILFDNFNMLNLEKFFFNFFLDQENMKFILRFKSSSFFFFIKNDFLQQILLLGTMITTFNTIRA